MHQKGFTRIELAIAVVLIALLAAAILFPCFARARERSRAKACFSRMNEIALAVDMYITDSDEHYPMSFYLSGSQIVTFHNALLPYLKSASILQCPTEINRMTYSQLQAVLPAPISPDFTSMGYVGNFAIFEDGSGNVLTAASHEVISVKEIPFPAETIIVADGEIELSPNFFNSPVVAPHLNKLNVAYCDGHARTIRATAMPGAHDYMDLGGDKKHACVIREGPYNGRYECWGVVQEDRTVGGLR